MKKYFVITIVLWVLSCSDNKPTGYAQFQLKVSAKIDHWVISQFSIIRVQLITTGDRRIDIPFKPMSIDWSGLNKRAVIITDAKVPQGSYKSISLQISLKNAQMMKWINNQAEVFQLMTETGENIPQDIHDFESIISFKDELRLEKHKKDIVTIEWQGHSSIQPVYRDSGQAMAMFKPVFNRVNDSADTMLFDIMTIKSVSPNGLMASTVSNRSITLNADDIQTITVKGEIKSYDEFLNIGVNQIALADVLTTKGMHDIVVKTIMPTDYHSRLTLIDIEQSHYQFLSKYQSEEGPLSARISEMSLTQGTIKASRNNLSFDINNLYFTQGLVMDVFQSQDEIDFLQFKPQAIIAIVQGVNPLSVGIMTINDFIFNEERVFAVQNLQNHTQELLEGEIITLTGYVLHDTIQANAIDRFSDQHIEVSIQLPNNLLSPIRAIKEGTRLELQDDLKEAALIHVAHKGTQTAPSISLQNIDFLDADCSLQLMLITEPMHALPTVSSESCAQLLIHHVMNNNLAISHIYAEGNFTQGTLKADTISFVLSNTYIINELENNKDNEKTDSELQDTLSSIDEKKSYTPSASPGEIAAIVTGSLVAGISSALLYRFYRSHQASKNIDNEKLKELVSKLEKVYRQSGDNEYLEELNNTLEKEYEKAVENEKLKEKINALDEEYKQAGDNVQSLINSENIYSQAAKDLVRESKLIIDGEPRNFINEFGEREAIKKAEEFVKNNPGLQHVHQGTYTFPKFSEQAENISAELFIIMADAENTTVDTEWKINTQDKISEYTYRKYKTTEGRGYETKIVIDFNNQQAPHYKEKTVKYYRK